MLSVSRSLTHRGAAYRRPRTFPRHLVPVLASLLAAAVSLYATAHLAHADVYDDFNTFCADNFGAEDEEEMYRKFGSQLRLEPGSDARADWVHASETSAVIGWSTNLPAVGSIEYGTTTAYGAVTARDERPFAVHMHYLRGLLPGTTYHFRLVATDERGNTVTSDDRTLATSQGGTVVRVPAEVDGPPYVLDQDNTTYLLTQDVVAPSTAFNVAGDGITLDLGGHTVVYDDVAGSPDPIDAGDYGFYGELAPCGVRTSDGTSTRIVNGTIRQGAGGGASDPTGYNPIFMRRPRSSEVAGVTVDYHGPQVSGVYLHSGHDGNVIHHNVVVDRGTLLVDRHAGADGITGVSGSANHNDYARYNLLKRVRHRGIRLGNNSIALGNEVYVDSWATNSYGIMYYSGNAERPVESIIILQNRVFGTGYHPIGVGSGYHAKGVLVNNNFIQVLAESPSAHRWPPGPGDPPGQLHPANGIRFHKGPQHGVSFQFNTIVAKARGTEAEMALARGLWLIPGGDTRYCEFVGNTIKQVALNEHASGSAIAALGVDAHDESSQIRYAGNIVRSNTANVRFGDNYAHGGKHTFDTNRFVRLGDDPRYATIKFGWQGWNFDSYGHRFINSTFEDGASYDSIAFEGSPEARYDFTVAWTLGIEAVIRARVTITDALGVEILAEDLTQGALELTPIDQYLREPGRTTVFTPHRVTIDIPGCDTYDETIVMDRPRNIRVVCPGSEVITAYLPSVVKGTRGVTLAGVQARTGLQEPPSDLPDRYQYAIGSGDAPGRFREPGGLAVGPGGLVHITDKTSNRVQVHDSDGSFVRLWGGPGDAEGRFETPQGIAVAADGTVYVADRWANRVQSFDRGGRLLETWDSYVDERFPNRPWQFAPRHVGVAPDGTVVADDWRRNHVLVFDATGGFRNRWDVPPAPSGSSSEVRAMAVDHSGNVVLALGDGRAGRYGLDGTPIDTWAMPGVSGIAATASRIYFVGTQIGLVWTDLQGNQIGQVDLADPSVVGGTPLLSPVDVAVGPDGAVHVADLGDVEHPSRVVRFAANGSFAYEWSGGTAAAGVVDPVAISRDTRSRLYVADRAHGRVQVFGFDGRHVATWGDGDTDAELRQPVAIASAFGGQTYVSDGHRKAILRLNESGNIEQMFGDEQGAGPGQFGATGPTDLAVAHEISSAPHHLRVVDTDNARVQLFDADGKWQLEAGGEGIGEGEFCAGCPRQVVADISGHTHVADWGGQLRVKVFDLNGDYAYAYQGHLGQDSRMSVVHDLAFEAGRIFMAESRNRVQVLEPDGTHVADIDTHRARPDMVVEPHSITLGPGASQLFVGDWLHNRVHVLGKERADGWHVSYHANPWVADVPVMVTDSLQLSLDLGGGSPSPELPADGFSLYASRFMAFPDGETTLYLYVDGMARLWVDDELVIDEWHEAREAHSAVIDVAAGEHFVQVEYADTAGAAILDLRAGMDGPPWNLTPIAPGTPSATATASSSATITPPRTPTPSLPATSTPSQTRTPTGHTSHRAFMPLLVHH